MSRLIRYDQKMTFVQQTKSSQKHRTSEAVFLVRSSDSTPPNHSPIETNVKWVLHKAHLHAYAATGGFNLRFSLNFNIFVIIKAQNLYRVILKVPRNKTLNLDYWYSALIFQKICKISQNLKSPKKLEIWLNLVSLCIGGVDRITKISNWFKF